MGNRLIQNSPSGQTTYGYDANNRLVSSGSTTYSYDPNGNLTSISNGTSFPYDAHNRLSKANLPGGLVVQYTYNGDGLKLRPIYETKRPGGARRTARRTNCPVGGTTARRGTQEQLDSRGVSLEGREGLEPPTPGLKARRSAC